MTTIPVKIPAFALGTWAWGDSGVAGEGYFGSGTRRADYDEIARLAQAAGFHLWDTATVYGMGRAETVLGQVLSRYPRESYQLSTKFTPQAAGNGPDPVAEMLALSLQRLGTDYIDLYWIHNPADVERWTPRLLPLLKQGTVRHVGVSNHNLAQIALADQILGEAGFQVTAVQNHYSLLHRSSERAGILDYCRQRGIPFFAYMVLEQGALSGRYSSANPLPEGTDRARHYNAVLPQLDALNTMLASTGDRLGAAAADVAIAWALAKGATPIVGVTRPDYLASLTRAAQLKLSPEDMGALEAAAEAVQVSTRGWWEQEMGQRPSNSEG